MSELPDLTQMQAKFVLMLTSDPVCIGKPKEAAIAAGYSPDTAHVQCHQLLNKPHVQAAIDKANREQISGPLAIRAVSFLGQVIDNPSVPWGVRVDASKTILDRAGIIAARIPSSFPDLSKDLSQMTGTQLSDLAGQASAARQQLEARLRDITPQPAQIEARAVTVDEDSSEA